MNASSSHALSKCTRHYGYILVTAGAQDMSRARVYYVGRPSAPS